MTTFQIVAIAILIGMAAWNYMPAFSWPKIPSRPKQSDTLTQISQVISIRESSTNPQVTQACNALLQALIG